jgi:hypothetical protein
LKSLLEGIKVKQPHDNEELENFIGFHINKRKSVETRETSTTHIGLSLVATINITCGVTGVML